MEIIVRQGLPARQGSFKSHHSGMEMVSCCAQLHRLATLNRTIVGWKSCVVCWAMHGSFHFKSHHSGMEIIKNVRQKALLSNFKSHHSGMEIGHHSGHAGAAGAL